MEKNCQCDTVLGEEPVQRTVICPRPIRDNTRRKNLDADSLEKLRTRQKQA